MTEHFDFSPDVSGDWGEGQGRRVKQGSRLW